MRETRVIFYVWMSQDGKEELKHYTYDPQMPSVPTQTLTVYGLEPGTDRYHSPGCVHVSWNTRDVRVELIDGQTTSGQHHSI